MWAHLERTQVLAAPFDAEILDGQNFRNEMGKFAQRVNDLISDFPAKELAT